MSRACNFDEDDARFSVIRTDGIYGAMLAVYDLETKTSYCYLRGTDTDKAHNLCALLNRQAEQVGQDPTPTPETSPSKP